MKFKATLERLQDGLGWTIVRVPFEPASVWKEMVRLRVRGEVNGFSFRTSLFPFSGGGYFLLVNKAVQRGAGVYEGKVAEFTLEPDLDVRSADLPDELSVLLDEAEGLRTWYDGLTEYTRREIGKWVNGVKSDAARLRRAEQTAERLLATMEAEVELPPLIATALKRKPGAMAGWQKMSAIKRRSELLAIFHYQTPESRAKRLAKTVEECAASKSA
jgi:Domain of unknown function (DUF1905)/Bacteriocin-protection, YdeI or OmpD-Associated